MKKLTLILSIFFVASVFSFSELQAQNSAPNNEEVMSENNSQLIVNVNQGLSSAEERKINIVVEDQKPD